MGVTLRQANERQVDTLSDDSTFWQLEARLNLAWLVDGDARLVNTYAVVFPPRARPRPRPFEVVWAAARSWQGYGRHHDEASDPKTLETVHDVTACSSKVPPGRQRTPAGTYASPLPADAGQLPVHLGSRGRFLGCIPRHSARRSWVTAACAIRALFLYAAANWAWCAASRVSVYERGRYFSSSRCPSGVLAFSASALSSLSVGSGAPKPLWNTAPFFGGVAGVPLASLA